MNGCIYIIKNKINKIKEDKNEKKENATNKDNKENNNPKPNFQKKNKKKL